MEKKVIQILIIEDSEEDVATLLRFLRHAEATGKFGHCHIETVIARGLPELGLLTMEPDVVLLDLLLPGTTTPLEFLQEVTNKFENSPIIVISGIEDCILAHKTIKHGACDFILKNELTVGNLARRVKFAIERFARIGRRESPLADEQPDEGLTRFIKLSEMLEAELTQSNER